MSGHEDDAGWLALSDGLDGYRDLFECVSRCRRLHPDCGWDELARMFEQEADIEVRKLAIGGFMTKALFEGSYEDLVAFSLIGARVLTRPDRFGEGLTREKLLALADGVGLISRQ
jgi:hypothetical protein